MSWAIAAGTMVQNVCAEGKREVSTSQSQKVQGRKCFVFGFPDEMYLSIRILGYFCPFPTQNSPRRNQELK